jgi:type I restriction enzyme, S subunit
VTFPRVKVEDFCRTGSGATPARDNPDYYGGNIPWIKSGELRETLISKSEEFVTQHALKSTALKLVPPGAILIAMYGATVGRVGLLGIEATTNQAVCHIVPDVKVADTRYLYHFMQSHAGEFIRRGVGGAQPNISQGMVRETLVPLPPLEEQKRIAAILDQADALRRLRARALDRLNALGQAIFHEMFGDVVKNPKGWERVKLGHLCEVGSSKRVFVEDFVPAGVPFYRGTEVGRLSVGQEIGPSLFISEDHYQNLIHQSGKPQIGDLLLPSICHDGRIWMVDHDDPFYFKDGRVLWIKSNDSKIDSEYLRRYLQNLFVQSYTSIASGTTFAELKIVNLKGLDVLRPPADLQSAFSSRIAGVDACRSGLTQAAIESTSLFTSLQHRAFRGEL